MTKATITSETNNVKISITLTREVNDKIVYLDGYEINAGKETYEKYDVELTGKISGKTIRSYGKPGGFAFFALQDKFSGKYPAGAYARIGDNYIDKEAYEAAMIIIAKLDSEIENPEFKSIKQQETNNAATKDAQIDAEAAEYARQISNGLCPKCGTYCYGDCQAN